MKHILMIGATSAIAEATARIFARRGDRLYLLARNQDRLSGLAEDLKIRGAASVAWRRFDADEGDAQADALAAAFANLGRVDVVLIAHGTLPDQQACQTDPGAVLAALHTNAVSTVSLLTQLANRLERQQGGSIAVITSVAGERGRQSNYVYGAAKAMVSVFLQGLRNRLHRSGVTVLDIKPGLVDTPMTAGFEKGVLWAAPETVAAGIVRALDAGRSVTYLPWFWRYLMLVVRSIPESIFKRLEL